MSKCAGCGPSCCRDHGSKRDMPPSLLEYDVVERILHEAMRKTLAWIVEIDSLAAQGRMDEAVRKKEEFFERNEKLVDWMTRTFCGENPHFASDPEWHPRGLAASLKEADAEIPREASSEETVEAAMRKFVADVSSSCGCLAAGGSDHDAAYAFEVMSTTWTNRLVGFYSE